jgi:pimeloyl-ACP methyl ester carboxylesterase
MLLPVEHLLRASLHARGYRSIRVATSVGEVHALDGRGGGPLPTVAMLHGLASAGIHLAPMMTGLRPWVRRVVAPDLLAHGYSATPAGGVTASSLRTGLVEALDALLDEPAVLLGNSLGGFVAVRYALARPERVRALVLLSPGGAPLTPSEVEVLRRSFRLRSHAEALAFVDRVFARPPRMRPLLAWGTRRKLSHASVQALLDALPTEAMLDADELRGLPMPTLVVWGQGDRVLPASSRRWFRDALPRLGHFVEPEGLGHSPYLEDAPRLCALVVDFLRVLALPAGA